jgi:DNA-binding response OmpR family regulator
METMPKRNAFPLAVSACTVSGRTYGEHRDKDCSKGSFLFDLRVLVIEDDADIAITIQRALQKSGIQAVLARNGAEAVSLKAEFDPQVVLVDLDLPDVDGDTLIRWLVQQQDCGIIVVSGHADEANRILSLELGADDYVTKPPNLRELVARIRAVHRRSIRTAHSGPVEAGNVAKDGSVGQRVTLASFVVDRRLRQVRDDKGRRVEVTVAEFAVLAALIDAKGLPVDREQLCELALHRPWRAEDRGVDQLIFGLRRKLPPSPDGQGMIQSIRNAGYALILADTPGNREEFRLPE